MFRQTFGQTKTAKRLLRNDYDTNMKVEEHADLKCFQLMTIRGQNAI